MSSIRNFRRRKWLAVFVLGILALFLLLWTHGPATEAMLSDFRSSILLTGPDSLSIMFVQQVTFRDSLGRTWNEATLLMQQSIPGGKTALEAKLLERANRK